MESKVVLVTPEIAEDFLRRSKGNPRYANQNTVNSRVVKLYASDMKRGKWLLTSEGISFNEDGNLVDGHHRLRAIIDAGVSIPMYVTTGVPNETVLFDRGLRRTGEQVLQFSCSMDRAVANNLTIAITKVHTAFSKGCSYADYMSDWDVKDFLEKNGDVFCKVTSLTNKGKKGIKIRESGFGHALFCALSCGVEYETLERFVEILTTGFATSQEEYAAILARNEILTPSITAHGVDGRKKRSAFYQNCIFDFVERNPRSRRYSNPRATYTEKMLGIERGG